MRSTLQTVNSELADVAANALQLSKNIKIVQKKKTDGNREQAYQALSRRPSVIAAIKYIISVAAQSEAWVCFRSHPRVVGSNPAGDMDACLLCLCCHLEVSATGRTLVQGSPTEFSVSACDLVTLTMRRPGPIRDVEP